VAENEGEYVLFESLHAAGSDTPREKAIGKIKTTGPGWRGVCPDSSAPPPTTDRRLHSAPPAKKARNIPPVLSSKMLRNFSIFCKFSGVADNPPPPPRVFQS
jgi:hypothetical protein